MNVTIFRDYKEELWESMEVYADKLVNGLQKIKDKNLMLNEYVWGKRISSHFPKKVNKYIRYIFRYVMNPIGVLFQKSDVNHIIDQANVHLLSILDGKKTVVTCHDLIVPYWQIDNIPGNSIKKRCKRIIELWRIQYLRKAAKIIAVSQSTKNDLVSILKIPTNKVIVIPEGVDPAFQRQSGYLINVIKHRYHLPKKYLLHVGTNHEYKNIERLLKLFSQLITHDHDLYLVKVGQQWTKTQSQFIKDNSLDDKILHCGFVPRSDLPGIYSDAYALLQPSYTEGFGLTVLEAMACGCPVILSDIPAFKELVHDAGVYIHVYDNRTDIQRILTLLRQKNLRLSLIKKGFKQAALFSWEKTAKQTLNVYKEIQQANFNIIQ